MALSARQVRIPDLTGGEGRVYAIVLVIAVEAMPHLTPTLSASRGRRGRAPRSGRVRWGDALDRQERTTIMTDLPRDILQRIGNTSLLALRNVTPGTVPGSSSSSRAKIRRAA
jgi:hypothetical protein